MTSPSNTEDVADYGVALLAPYDAAAIGYKLVEMADRVKATSPALPGVSAEWLIKIDGEEYRVVIRQASHTKASKP